MKAETRADKAYYEIQQYCNKVHGCMFFADMSEDEFREEARQYMIHIQGWMIPTELEQSFVMDKNARHFEKWKKHYVELGVFHAFEDDGKLYFNQKSIKYEKERTYV